LTNILQCILADFELVNPPAQGCAIRPGETAKNIGPEHVQELVHEVLHEMKNRGLL
jgi:hypothetical protein